MSRACYICASVPNGAHCSSTLRMHEREEADVKRLFSTAAFVKRDGCQLDCSNTFSQKVDYLDLFRLCSRTGRLLRRRDFRSKRRVWVLLGSSLLLTFHDELRALTSPLNSGVKLASPSPSTPKLTPPSKKARSKPSSPSAECATMLASLPASPSVFPPLALLNSASRDIPFSSRARRRTSRRSWLASRRNVKRRAGKTKLYFPWHLLRKVESLLERVQRGGLEMERVDRLRPRRLDRKGRAHLLPRASRGPSVGSTTRRALLCFLVVYRCLH